MRKYRKRHYFASFLLRFRPLSQAPKIDASRELPYLSAYTIVVFQRLPELELAVAELVLADLSACRAELSAFINWAKLGQAEPMKMPLWEGSGSSFISSWPELSLAPGTLSAAWGALQITCPPIAANFPLRYHSWTIYTK